MTIDNLEIVNNPSADTFFPYGDKAKKQRTLAVGPCRQPSKRCILVNNSMSPLGTQLPQ